MSITIAPTHNKLCYVWFFLHYACIVNNTIQIVKIMFSLILNCLEN